MRIGIEAASGSDGLMRVGAKAAGSVSDLDFVISASRFHTDGYRDHSATDRRLGNAKFTLRPDADSKLTLIINSVALPEAQDPLGLSRSQLETNPRGVDASALDYSTRKTVDQTQAGLIYERRLGEANSVQLMAYGGHRFTQQFQSIPKTSQLSATHPGGVIDLARDYQGVDLRWTLKSVLLGSPLILVSGLTYDGLDERRRGHQSFAGNSLGVLGALRRNENNKASSLDKYLQAGWQLTQQFSLNAGVRNSRVAFKSLDHYIVTGNPDDSGRASYGAMLPVVGALYALGNDLHLYASAGRGFETPTLNELAYRSGGQTGLNFGLQAATSNSVEAGVKARLGKGLGEFSVATFETRTKREIVTQTNSGGRTTYQNAGGTKRTGLELAWSANWLRDLKVQSAATLLTAEYTDTFSTCTVTPCAAPSVPIPVGNRIPGIARGSLFASLGWLPVIGWRGGIEIRHLSRVPVNDANTEVAGSFTVAAAHAGYSLKLEHWELAGFVRCDNLTKRKYAGSVIVNESNNRFFEPAPGRTWVLGASVRAHF